MIITKLELENWMRIQRLALEFRQGINLIYGPNEIGKSSIIEAIRQALVGDAASTKKDYEKFIPWGTEVKANVNLFFTTGDGSEYHIRKSFPRGEAYLYLKGILLSEESKKTQGKLLQALGLTEQTLNLLDLLFIHQGKALNIFDTRNKQNPIANDDTRSYIKEVIKETAFKSLQEFQGVLNQERDRIFTNPDMKKFSKGKNACEYIRLLEKERELSREAAELETRTAEYMQRLEEMEKLEKDLRRWTVEKSQKEEFLGLLEKKEVRVMELERKRLEFQPLNQDYQRYLEMERQLEVLAKELPALYVQRKQILVGLEEELAAHRLKLREIRQRQVALKRKKEEGERLEKVKQEVDILKRNYTEMQRLQQRVREIENQLPVLLALNLRKAGEKAAEIQSRHDEYLKKQGELKNLEERLRQYPQVTDKEMGSLRSLSGEIVKLSARLEAARSALNQEFKLTPYPTRKVQYRLKVDQGEWAPRVAIKPEEIKGYRQLFFQYPGEFDIQVSGSPAEIDMDKLQAEYQEKQREMARQLERLAVKTIEELEEKFKVCADLKNQQGNVQIQLRQMTSLQDLENQRIELSAEIKKLNEDIEKYRTEAIDIDKIQQELSTEQLKTSTQIARDRLTEAKVSKDRLVEQLNNLLQGRSVQDFEKEYGTREKENLRLQEAVAQMEPREILQVTAAHLDKVEEELKLEEKAIAEKERDKNLLESMEPHGMGDLRRSFGPSLGALIGAPGLPVISSDTTKDTQLIAAPNSSDSSHHSSFIIHHSTSLPLVAEGINSIALGFHPQQLRDTINTHRTSLTNFQEQKQDLLKGRNPGDFKKDYLLKKDEVEVLAGIVSAMEPKEVNAAGDIRNKITTLERELRAIDEGIGTSRANKARLSGEISGFGDLVERKQQVEYSHGEILENIKNQLIDIYALKLWLKVIEEEKQRVQREIFKPLEERVARKLELLIPGKYYPILTDELEISIDTRALTGEKLVGIEEFLSFGTREQLAFLLRLAIAEQLSQKEPQAMILDDAFVNTDQFRLSQLLAMILGGTTGVQFLIFTCKPQEYLQHREQLHLIDLETAMQNY